MDNYEIQKLLIAARQAEAQEQRRLRRKRIAWSIFLFLAWAFAVGLLNELGRYQ
jgi:hypothetical protein